MPPGVRRVDALDVERWIGFGKAEALRFGQHGRERQALGAHFRQDEIARAVDDARDPLDAVGGQALAQHLDRRNATGDGRFKSDHDVVLPRGVEDFVAVKCQQRLICRHDVFAADDRGENGFFRDGRAADHFDDDVDVAVGDDLAHVVDDRDVVPNDRAGALDVPRGDHGDLDAPAGAAGDFFSIAFENAERAAADRSDAQESDAYGFHRCGLGSNGVNRPPSIVRRRSIPGGRSLS